MRASKEAAADWRPRRHQMANTQSHFSLRTNANTIETIIQFCGERMGPRENPPAIPDAPLDRTAFPKDNQPIRNRSIHASSKGDSEKSARRVRQGLGESEFGRVKA